MAFTPKLNDYFLGRDVAIDIALGDFDESPTAEYVELGGTRGVSDSMTSETSDLTNRSTPGSFRQKLTTWSEMTGSIDGISIKGDAHNVKSTRNHFVTDRYKRAWLRLTAPNGADGATEVMEVPIVITQFDNDYSYEGEPTWTLSWESQGAPAYVEVPAPAPA